MTYKSYRLGLSLLALVFGVGVLMLVNVKVLLVVSESMRPALHEYDLILVRPRLDYFENDIVTYRRHGSAKLITHRIVQKRQVVNQSVYFVKGDNNMETDLNPITSSEIVGKLVLTLPAMGRAFTPVWLLWLFYLPCGWLFGFLLKTFPSFGVSGLNDKLNT